MGDFEAFYIEKSRLVYKAAWAYLFDKNMVEDVVQDVFLIALQKFKELHTHENIDGWLMEVMKNCARKTARKHIPQMDSEQYFDDLGLLEILPASFPEAETRLLQDYYERRQSIAFLSLRYRTSPNAICIRLCRARARLRLYLQDGGVQHGSVAE